MTLMPWLSRFSSGFSSVYERRTKDLGPHHHARVSAQLMRNAGAVIMQIYDSDNVVAVTDGVDSPLARAYLVIPQMGCRDLA